MVKSIFRTIYNGIRDDIVNGTYPFQSLLPTEAELCERFDCSHSTVRRALLELTQDGYVQPRQGRGVTVIWQPIPDEARGYATGGIETFQGVCTERGFSPRTELLSFEKVVVDDALARSTGMPLDSTVVRMERVRYADGKPVAHELTCQLADEIPGLTPEIAISGTYAHIEQTLGLQVLVSKRIIALEAADEAMATHLAVPTGTYVARIEAHTFDSNGVMFEHILMHQHPSFFSARIIGTRSQL